MAEREKGKSQGKNAEILRDRPGKGSVKLAWRLDLIFAFGGGNLAPPFSTTPLRAAAGNP